VKKTVKNTLFGLSAKNKLLFWWREEENEKS
jgi:hypothetical protein